MHANTLECRIRKRWWFRSRIRCKSNFNLMRAQKERWCSVAFNILQQFLLSSCGTTTSKMKWKSKNSLKRCGASHSMKISHLNKIHFSLDPLKERSAEYHHVSDLVAEQRAFWQNSLCKRVSIKREAGVWVYRLFLENAVLGLGLWLG